MNPLILIRYGDNSEIGGGECLFFVAQERWELLREQWKHVETIYSHCFNMSIDKCMFCESRVTESP